MLLSTFYDIEYWVNMYIIDLFSKRPSVFIVSDEAGWIQDILFRQFKRSANILHSYN